MALEDFEEYNRKTYKFNINVEFDTHIDLTERIVKVSEAFGLGVNERKKFTIFKDFKIGFSAGDVVFITGDSGGGKSILLKELKSKLTEVYDMNDFQPDKSERVIEGIGKDLDEAIKLLSVVGLNDAFIFLRKYGELSDGQKYRYRLAKIFQSNPKFVFIDEFCANLDRTTAKVIAYNLQRIARKTGTVLFCATTHTDIRDDLNPSVLVEKRFMDEVKINYYPYEKKRISFYDDVTVEEGTMRDYEKLAKYHYKNTGTNFPYTKIVAMKYKNELAGVAVMSPPFLQTKGRTIKFAKKYSLMTKPIVAEINKFFIRGSRYIISPKFRACGLGQKLAYDTMMFVPEKRYIEVVTVMGQYNPVFERIGMEKIEISEESDGPTIKLYNWLEQKGLKIDEVHNPRYLRGFIEALTISDKTNLKFMMGKVMHHPKLGLSSKDGRRAEVVAQEKRYIEVPFEEVHNEILSHLPKLYSGSTFYYIMKNPFYTGEEEKVWF